MNFNKPQLDIEVYEIPKDLKSKYWEIFKKHHYLDGAINKGARCWVAYLWGNPVAFNSVLAMPSGSLKRAWREHRLVVLSDYQGMGIGSAMSECVGEILLSEGKRFFSKTANIKLGSYRNAKPKWRPTSKNGIARKDHLKSKRENYNNMINKKLSLRVCYSHEYIGETDEK
jgi:GNAT superfamily N-acetyltransferase